MSHTVPWPEQRLEALDERLRTIQAELEEDVGPAPSGVAPPPPVRPPAEPPPPPRAAPPPAPVAAPPPSPALASRPAEGLLVHLLASMRELLSGYEVALVAEPPSRATTATPATSTRAAPPAPSEAPAGGSQEPAAGRGLTVTAGPFAGVAIVEEFERALRELPGVAEVAVRGYEGRSRAIFEVQLRRPVP